MICDSKSCMYFRSISNLLSCNNKRKLIQKDPFYELEMPIRCELFTNAVENLIERVSQR